MFLGLGGNNITSFIPIHILIFFLIYNSVLRSAQDDITTSTYSMLTRVHSWTAFSNHTVGDGGSNSNSLEAIHDGIHVNVGGFGHMSDPAVAG